METYVCFNSGMFVFGESAKLQPAKDTHSSLFLNDGWSINPVICWFLQLQLQVWQQHLLSVFQKTNNMKTVLNCDPKIESQIKSWRPYSFARMLPWLVIQSWSVILNGVHFCLWFPLGTSADRWSGRRSQVQTPTLFNPPRLQLFKHPPAFLLPTKQQNVQDLSISLLPTPPHSVAIHHRRCFSL